MDIDWPHKIPKINSEEILLSSLKKHSDTAKMPSHQTFYYPKRGGFQEIFNAIAAKIGDKIILNSPVTSLKKENDHWLINGKYQAKKIINTAPWPNLFSALNSPAELKKDFDNLRFNSLVVSLWETPYNHDWHWLYIPDLEKENHREFFINNFAPHSNRAGIYTETNLKRWPGKNKPWRNGLRPIAEFITPAAYPIPTIGHTASIANILKYYEKQNLFGLGRWGQWQYFNGDVCILEAMKFVARLD
jgi:protoporphyrinogen oxidase